MELNNTDHILLLTTSYAVKWDVQLIGLHVLPTLAVITVSQILDTNCRQHFSHDDSRFQKYLKFVWTSHNKHVSGKWRCTKRNEAWIHKAQTQGAWLKPYNYALIRWSKLLSDPIDHLEDKIACMYILNLKHSNSMRLDRKVNLRVRAEFPGFGSSSAYVKHA